MCILRHNLFLLVLLDIKRIIWIVSSRFLTKFFVFNRIWTEVDNSNSSSNPIITWILTVSIYLWNTRMQWMVSGIKMLEPTHLTPSSNFCPHIRLKYIILKDIFSQILVSIVYFAYLKIQEANKFSYVLLTNFLDGHHYQIFMQINWMLKIRMW